MKRARSSLAICGFTNTRKVLMLSDYKGDSKSITWTEKTWSEDVNSEEAKRFPNGKSSQFLCMAQAKDDRTRYFLKLFKLVIMSNSKTTSEKV